MVFQSFNLFENLNVLENTIVAQTTVLKRDHSEAEKNCQRESEKSRYGRTLLASQAQTTLRGDKTTRGHRPRLSMNPDAILFDEPTSALDP